MTKKLFPLFSVLVIAAMVLAACAQPTPVATETAAPVESETAAPAATETTAPVESEPVTINLWTKEGEADGGLQYV